MSSDKFEAAGLSLNGKTSKPDPFNPKIYHPQADIDKLISQLRGVFDGNQVRSSELVAHDFSAMTFYVNLALNFDFEGDCQEKITAGRHDEAIHFGKDRQEFIAH